MIPQPSPGHDLAEYRRMAELLTAAIDTGWLSLELVAFYARTLGQEQAAVIQHLTDMIGQLRQLRGLPAGPLTEGEKPV
jgi:hypothetical protein